MRQPDQSDIFVLPKEKKFKGYYKISRHYGWALNTTFKAGFEYVICVEGKLNSVTKSISTNHSNYSVNVDISDQTT